MTDEEIRRIVREVMAEERREANDHLDAAVLKTVSAILTGFGIEDDERKEFRADFQYLRRWRQGSEQVGRVGVTAIVTVVISGFLGAAWIVLKTMLGKGP